MTHSVLTVGIDLSVDDDKTAVCAIRWQAGAGQITTLRAGWTNESLRGLIRDADWSGIDTPLSWPVRFRDALAGHFERGGWPPDYRSPHYQFRSTDRFVEEIACRPLSVSTNLLGITAMRCARLLQEIGEDLGGRISLTGADQIVEVYPAATLTAWGAAAAGFNPKGYKNGQADRSCTPPTTGLSSRLNASESASTTTTCSTR